MIDTLLKIDGDILLWIQDNLRAGWLDPIMKFITYLANGGALWIGICVLLGAQSDFSFPSGHSGASFAVAVVMFMEMPKKYGVPALIVATLIAFSRLYVGVHYPFDVIAGVLTGTIYAVITVAIYRKIFKDKKHPEK